MNKKVKVQAEIEIIPSSSRGTGGRTGSLLEMDKKKISEKLGFKPNLEKSLDGKVKNEWAFSIDGKQFGIWDYKGSEKYGQFSTNGDRQILKEIFGANYKAD